MGYFNKEDLKLIKIGIKGYGKTFYRDESFDEEKYFRIYVNFLKKSDEERRMMYFVNTDYDQTKMQRAKGANMSKKEAISYVFGRDCYIVARAIQEGRPCKLSEFGYIEIDGKSLTKPDMQNPFGGEELGDFEEDEIVLPNISDNYYQD